MAADPKIPRAQTSVDKLGGLITPEWYRFFQQLLLAAQEAGILPGVIEDILARLSELEQESEQSFLIQGLVSVQVLGTPSDGFVQLQLLGDVDAPGNTYYYGTGPTGTKGWFAVSDTVEAATGELTKAVASDGVTTFGLADVPNGGDGAFQLFFRDAKGRVVATTPGDSDNVPEGATNLYFTAARAQAAVDDDIMIRTTFGF